VIWLLHVYVTKPHASAEAPASRMNGLVWLKLRLPLQHRGSTPRRSTKDTISKRGIRNAILALVRRSDYRVSEGDISVFGGPDYGFDCDVEDAVDIHACCGRVKDTEKPNANDKPLTMAAHA